MSRRVYKKIKRDYKRKAIKNPFFNTKKGSAKKNYKLLRFKYFISLIFIVLIALIWFFTSSSVWVIKNIEIEGLTRYPNSEIKKNIYRQYEDTYLNIFKQNNIFIFNKKSVINGILEDHNFFSLTIKKKLPNTLVVVINERPYSFIYEESDKYFYSSSEGYILKQIDKPDDTYFIIKNNNDDSLIDSGGCIKISDKYLKFILELDKILKDKKDLTLEKYIIDHEFNTIKAKFKDGPKVFFNTKNDPKEQVENLSLVKKQKIKDNFNKVEYIDLRYHEKTFIFPSIN